MEKAKKRLRCAYCEEDSSTVDHVVPRALYPPSKAGSNIQRITVQACSPCNKSWVDDEPHFRSMMLISGEPTVVVRELWEGKTRRSFAQPDGHRRAGDLAAQLVPIEMSGVARHMVYPAQDERVMRIVRKIIRGLCHHHALPSPVADGQVWADVQRYVIPPDLLAAMVLAHAEEDVFQYRFSVLDDPAIHSCWLLQFYGRTPFFGIVYRSIEARNQTEAVLHEPARRTD